MIARALALFLLLTSCPAFLSSAEPAFRIYAPSRSTESLLVVEATPNDSGLLLEAIPTHDLGFAAATIAAHPDEPLLYVSTNRTGEDGSPGAVLSLDEDGDIAGVRPFTADHGYSYLSLDRGSRFLLGCNYGDGFVDVYELDDTGLPGPAVSSLNEGRPAAHCVLPSPDNAFVYIPYVKESNALLQYRFDADTGALTALETLDAKPPAGTGPRHLAYHPELPMLYFSNEQHLGVSVYEKLPSGQLEVRQVCDLTGPEAPEDGVSSSDIVITADGRFLFAGIRGHKHDFDWISRYEVLPDGTVKHLGLTPADAIPWGLALSPGGEFLLATGFKSGTLMAFRIGGDGTLERVATLDWDPQVSDIVTR